MIAKIREANLRIFVMGNKGYASKILQTLLLRKVDVVGICCRKDYPLRVKLKESVRAKVIKWGLYNKELFQFQNPFERYESPRKIAASNRIPVLYAGAIKKPEFENTLRMLNPDLILVAGFHRLIPANIIRIPKLAIINFHPSLLPKHRGGTPNRWIIRNGEKETGITVHFLDEKFDTGDIICQEKIDVNPNDTWGDVEHRLVDLSIVLLDQILEKIKKGTLNGTPQQECLATYESSYKGDHTVIDWSLSAHEIKQICYAIKPLSGGMTKLGMNKFCIWEVIELERHDPNASPGEIIEIDNENCPIVACGEGQIKIVQFLSNGRIVRASKIVKQMKLQRGFSFY